MSWEADLLRDLAPIFAPDLSVGVHLAVLVEPYLSRIMDGTKTIESRWSMNRCAPFGVVAPGDAILLKRSGGPIVGFALALKVASGTVRPRGAARIVADCGPALGVEHGFAEHVKDKRYVTLITLAPPWPLRAENVACGKRDRAGWNVLRARGGRLC